MESREAGRAVVTRWGISDMNNAQVTGVDRKESGEKSQETGQGQLLCSGCH